MLQIIDLFVYSGTGNTWKAAECICHAAEAQGVACSILPIDANSMPKEYCPRADHLLGLMAPTLGAIQPWSLFRFLARLPRGNRQSVFLAATGAWTKIGKLFVPGFVGFGLYLAALILLIKGYRIAGIDGFGMPHNWTTLIPPYRDSTEQQINREIPVATGAFITELLAGRRVFRRIGDLVIGLIILPIPFLFLLFGHMFLAKTMFAGEGCNGCGLCAKNCPRQAIRMYGKQNPRPYWTLKCEQCMRCAGYCPKAAVYCNSFLVLAFVVVFSAIPIESLIARALFDVFPQLSGFGQSVIVFLLYYAVVVSLAVLIYALFHLLGRISAVNRIYTRLSFTHYWRKYRHADVPLTTLTKR